VVVFLADVKFASNNRFHALLVRRIHEVDRAKNVAVVGHGHGRHTQLAYMLAELFDVTSAIEQGIVSMQMQVDELGHGLSLV
jgi:hypothetical protein